MPHFQISSEMVWSAVTGFSPSSDWVLRAAGRGTSPLAPYLSSRVFLPSSTAGAPRGATTHRPCEAGGEHSCQGAAAPPGRGDGAQPWPRHSPARRSAPSPGTQMDPCPHLLGTSSLSASPVKHFPLYKIIMTHHYFTTFFPYFYKLRSLV